MGVVVLSIDAELAWGFHDLHPLSESQRDRLSRARERWLRLIDLFETYDIKATWAVVGNLLADNPEYAGDSPHSNGWFRTAREEFRENPDNWRGGELVDTIESAAVDHELASHSFSHAVFSDTEEEVAAAECRLTRQIGHENGFDFRSFVFPRNEIAHRDILAESGFVTYRGNRPERLPNITGLRGMSTLVGHLAGIAHPPTVVPRVDEYGLVNVPASMFLGGFREGPWSKLTALGEDPATQLAKRGIDAASAQDRVFHLWLHPHDLTEDRYVQRVRDVLEYIATKCGDGAIQVATMAEIGASVTDAGTASEQIEAVPVEGND